MRRPVPPIFAVLLLSAVSLAAEPSFQTPQARLVHLYTADAPVKADPGLLATDTDGILHLALAANTPFSDLTFTDLAAFDPQGLFRVDLAGIKDGDATVQLACYDADRQLITSFDFLKAITEPGIYELPLACYRSAIPDNTKYIAPRLFLGGKPTASAAFRSIAYATSPTIKVLPPDRTIPHYTRAKQGTWNLPGPPPFVVAHYVDWFSLDQPLAGETWAHWSFQGPHGHDPTKTRPDGLRDIASVLYPLIGPYASNDPAAVHYHLATLKAAGVNAIIVDWYGQGHASDLCLPVLFDTAESLDMKIALCVEEKMFCVWKNPASRDQMKANMVAALKYAMARWTPRKGYLKRDGVPFMIQFNSYGTGPLGPVSLTPDEWREVFPQLPGPVIYCRQNLDPIFHPPIQAAYCWWAEGAWPEEFIHNAVRLRDDQHRLAFFMTFLGTGFNDTGVWGWGDGPRISKRHGLDALKWSESIATQGDPELIQLVTWNDFNEGTCFEPTLQSGFTAIDEVEQFIGRLHHRPVNLDDNRTPYQTYKRTASAEEKREIPSVDPSVLKPK